MTVNDPAWFRALPGWQEKRFPRRVHRIHDDRFNLMVEALNAVAAIIPDNGELAGIYRGSVVCEGDAQVTDDVVIQGSLVVLGELVNSGGFDFTVRGSVSAKDIYFARTPSTSPTGDITIDGDLICTYFDFPQSGGVAKQLRVQGDFIVAGGGGGINTVNCQGVSGTVGNPGATVIVYGDLVAGPVRVYGGDGSNGNAGNGGNLEVYGCLTLEDDANLSGGDSLANGNGGIGGSLEVRGDLNAGFCSVRITGGTASAGSGGDGGSLSVDGIVQLNNLLMFGGYCDSPDPTHRAGNGGMASIDCGLIANTDVEFQGGDRGGTVTGPGTQTPASGGNLSVDGAVVIDGDLILDGGSVFSGASSPHAGGDGGQFYCLGPATISYIDCNGGDDQGANGRAGSVAFRSGATVSTLNMGDGGGAGTAPTGAILLEVAGSCFFDNLNMTDRVGALIQAWNAPALLKINSMADKTTLNDGAGVATGDISANLADSVFISATGGAWYGITGAAV